MIKLKICGMREEQNILKVGELQPDYMGFIFYPKSPRFAGVDFAIPSGLSKSVKRVGVFVNEETDKMIARSGKYGFDYLQLHGHESVEQCRELKRQGVKVIKVFAIDESMDFKITKPYQEVVDFFLFDTKGKYHGGNASTFNWTILEKYDQQVSFFLSGGLGPKNIESVKKLKGMNLHAVDINSGVEESAALKSIDKIIQVKNILNSVF